MTRSSTRTHALGRFRFQQLEERRLLASLSDEFDNPATLADWQRINETEGWNADQLEQFDIDTTQPGRLVMAPHTVTWFENWRGPMVYKEVTGDFAFTTNVHVSDRDEVGDSDADDVPDGASFSLAGLMIRTPRPITDPAIDWQPGSQNANDPPNGENYVFLSLGHGVDGRMSFEVKTTINSRSQLELTPVDVPSAEIQLARIGSAVFAMYRLPGQEWTVHRRYDRPDMPATLQIGLVTYSDWGGMNHIDPAVHNGTVYRAGEVDSETGRSYAPDLVAGFDYARVVEPDVPPELAGVDLFSQATDQQLLSFLGESANVPAPVGGVVGRHLFHNDSAFDGSAAANANDDHAIAADKLALLADAGPAARANYTNSAAGITGVMIDVEGLIDGDSLDAATDFSFRVGNDDNLASWRPLAGSDLPAVSVRVGAGIDGSDRVTLIWPAGTIVGTWLEVTTYATASTGLAEADRFYFGNAPGDSVGTAGVDASDFAAVRANLTSFLERADTNNAFDHNHDGQVNAADLLIVRDHATSLGSALVMISPESESPLGKHGSVALPMLSELWQHRQISLRGGIKRVTSAATDSVEWQRMVATDSLMAAAAISSAHEQSEQEPKQFMTDIDHDRLYALMAVDAETLRE